MHKILGYCISLFEGLAYHHGLRDIDQLKHQFSLASFACFVRVVSIFIPKVIVLSELCKILRQ